MKINIRHTKCRENSIIHAKSSKKYVIISLFGILLEIKLKQSTTSTTTIGNGNSNITVVQEQQFSYAAHQMVENGHLQQRNGCLQEVLLEKIGLLVRCIWQLPEHSQLSNSKEFLAIMTCRISCQKIKLLGSFTFGLLRKKMQQINYERYNSDDI